MRSSSATLSAFKYAPRCVQITPFGLPVGLAAPTPPPDTLGWTENWLDVNLTQNVITARDGQAARGVFPTSPGRPGWATTRGKHRVRYQMPVQDLSGADYYVRGVQCVSYFLMH